MTKVDEIPLLANGASTAAFDRALRRIVAEMIDGLRHGYFDFRVTCEVIAQGRRRMVLHAGKSYQFLIEAHQCDTATSLGDPHHEGANQSNQ